MKIDNIKWDCDETVDRSIVTKVESQLEVKFPSLYVDIVTEHNGAQPKVLNEYGEWRLGIVKTNKKHFEKIGFCFLKYAYKGNENLNRVVSVHKSFKDTVPDSKKIIPFADDGGGNYFYFDFRKDENNSSIVFQDHEEAYSEEDLAEDDIKRLTLTGCLELSLTKIANSFEEMLESISPDE